MKKLLLTLLSVLMICGLVTTNVFADDEIKTLDVTTSLSSFEFDLSNSDEFLNPFKGVVHGLGGTSGVNCTVFLMSSTSDFTQEYSHKAQYFGDDTFESWKDSTNSEVPTPSNADLKKYVVATYTIWVDDRTFAEDVAVTLDGKPINTISYEEEGYPAVISTDALVNPYAVFEGASVRIQIILDENGVIYTNDTEEKYTTELTYEVGSSYTWKVPASTAISTEGTTLTGLEVTSASLVDGEKVQIKVASTNNWKLKSGSNEVAYTLALTSGGDALVNDTVVLKTGSTEEPVSQSLYANIPTAGTKAGKYSDTLTFTASILPAPPKPGIYVNGEFKGELTLDNCKTDASGVKELIKDIENASVVLPSGVTSIGGYAFVNCNNLVSITIPNTVTIIADYAFSSCTNLTTVTFEEGSQLETIGHGAFCDASNISSITLPNTVATILSWAFSGTQLSSLTIPSSVMVIGGNAFGESTFAGVGDVIIDESYITRITNPTTRSDFPWGASKINGATPVNPWQ